MEVKEGVELKDLDICMRPVLIEAEKIWKRYGREEGVTITCTAGDVHSAGSLHPYGLAIDMRIRYFSQEELDAVHKEMVDSLDIALFDIIVHSTHMHVEYDPK